MDATNSSRIGANISALLGSQLATWSMTLAWTLVVPRLLGPAGVGLLVLAWSASGLLAIVGGLASRTLLVKEIAADPQAGARLLGTALALRTACILPCVALTLLYIRLGHFTAAQVLVLYLAAALSVSILLLEPLQAAFQAIERMEYLAYGEVLNKAVITALSIVLVVLGFTAVSIVGAMVIAGFLIVLLSGHWLRRHFTIDWTISRAAVSSMLSSSTSYWAYSFFFTFYLWIDSAMLALLTPASVVGWYGVPTRLFGTLLFLPMIVSTAWLPRLAASYRESPDRLRSIAAAPLDLLMTVMLPVSVGAALVGGPVIRLLYGPAFDPAVPVFSLLAVTLVPMSINMIVYQILVATNRQAIWTAALAGACIVNPALNFFLIRYSQAAMGNGAIGAALSLLLTETLIAVLALALARPYLRASALQRLARAGAATLGMALIVQAGLRFGLVAGLAAGLLGFVLLATVLQVVSLDEWHNLRWQATVVWRRFSRPALAPAEEAR